MNRILVDFLDFANPDRLRNPLSRILQTRYELVLHDNPDFVFFTHDGRRHRLYSCTKIFYTQECYAPNWKICDYALTSIKIDDPRAFHLPYYSLWTEPGDLIRSGQEDWRAELGRKTGFCSFLSGYADRTVRERTVFFQKLDARKHVDSSGKALNNSGRRVPYGREPKLDYLRSYKFHIAFENKDLPGWTTEKFTDAFAARTVPVFWGDVTVQEQFNPEAFVNRKDFDSDEACIEHLLKLDANDDLYLKYLSAPPFHGNRPNKEWDRNRLLDFLDDVFCRRPDPVARRRWFWKLTRWRLVKRLRTHEEMRLETATERAEARRKARG